MCIHVSAIVEEGSESESMETEVTRYGSHTESRMRENCTYGSMRGRAHPTGRSALLYTLCADACIQKTVRGNSRCCIEGPVFSAGDLVWE